MPLNGLISLLHVISLTMKLGFVAPIEIIQRELKISLKKLQRVVCQIKRRPGWVPPDHAEIALLQVKRKVIVFGLAPFECYGSRTVWREIIKYPNFGKISAEICCKHNQVA